MQESHAVIALKSSRILDQMETHWGMKTAGALMALPSIGVSVMRWSRAEARPYEFAAVDRRDFLVLTVNLQPMQACSHVDGREVWAGPIRHGSVRLVQAERRAGWSSSCPFDLLHIHVPMAGLKTTARRMGIDFAGFEDYNGPLYHEDETSRVLANQFLGVLGDHTPAARLFADGIAQALVAHLLRSYDHVARRGRPVAGHDDGLRAAFEHIERHPHEALGVARLAAIAGMSEFHFARRFKQRYGITPHACLLDVRLRQARMQLSMSNANVLQVAMDCGFADSSHFARLFRRAEGVTPLRYREAQQGAQ